SGNYTYSWTSNPSGFTSTIANPIVSPSVSTTYNVSVNDGNNTAQSSVNVTVNYVPGAASQPNGPDSIDLHYTSVSQYTTIPVANTEYYNWILEPANMGTISGNGTSISITWSGMLGIASLSVQAINACGAGMGSNTLLIHVDNSVGLDNPSINTLSIYPNPSNGRFTITSQKSISAVYLYDVSGRQIPPSPPFVKGALVEMNCGHLPKGLYFVHVYMDDQVKVMKMALFNSTNYN
ncbi:MAG: T9SS type A sorting domain-containing protein, partial [Ignavibacteria bacterium]|nr:T9SS type A sorting domain-containing protein [Ignavibacteria bacterium]